MKMDKYKIKIGDQFITVEVEKVGGTVDPPPVDPPVDPPVIPPVTTAGFKVGVNGFPWFPLRLLEGIGMKWVRCYLSSGWVWRPDGLAVQPMHQAETNESHGMDDYLLRAKKMGVNVLLTIHQTPEWYRNTGRGDGANDYAPCKSGANRKDPASYKDYAAFLFQVAARYGRVKHPESALRVDTTPRWNGDVLNVKKSALNHEGEPLLTYLEPWNESSKWWKIGTPESEAYFEPEETAALMSACYDGHEGVLGAGVGIKTADPSMVVVMPALTDFEFDYIAKMDAWFNANRKDKKWPCQIMNHHHYSNIGNRYKQHPAQWVQSGACLPKDDQNFRSITEIVKFGKDRGFDTWLSECGADTKAPSMMHSKGVGKTDEAFQAEIIIESIKAYKDAGVDAVFIFTGPDEVSGADGGQFETCGLWESESKAYKPKASSDAVRAYLAANAPKASKRVVAQGYLPKMAAAKRPDSK